MLARSLLIVGALFGSTQVLAAAPASVAMHDEDPQYDTLATFDVSLPNGASTWGFDFEEAQAPTDLSIWHIQEPGCRGFGIVSVRVMADADDAAWVTLTPNVFDGIAHFKAEAAYSHVEMTLTSDRLLRSNCRILIRKANFVVPQVVTLLAKIEAPICIPDDGDTEREECSYAMTRIDLPTRDLITIAELDVTRFGLVAEAFYRLQGYVEELDDGTSRFVIQSATRVM